MSSHLTHPFLCVHFEPPFSSYSARVYWLTFLSLIHLLSSQRHALLLTPPPNKAVPCPLWEPSPADPFPTIDASSADFVAAGAGVPIFPGKYCCDPNGSTLSSPGPMPCSKTQGWCPGQGFGQWAGRNSPSPPRIVANHLLIVLNEKQIPRWYFSAVSHPGNHSLSNWDRIRKIKGEFDFTFLFSQITEGSDTTAYTSSNPTVQMTS